MSQGTPATNAASPLGTYRFCEALVMVSATIIVAESRKRNSELPAAPDHGHLPWLNKAEQATFSKNVTTLSDALCDWMNGPKKSHP